MSEKENIENTQQTQAESSEKNDNTANSQAKTQGKADVKKGIIRVDGKESLTSKGGAVKKTPAKPKRTNKYEKYTRLDY